MTQSTLTRSTFELPAAPAVDETVEHEIAEGDVTRDVNRTAPDSLQSVIEDLIARATTTATPDLDAFAPEGATSCRRRADVYARLRMWDAALAQYERAIDRDASDVRARCSGAIARYALGDFDGALVFIEQALALEPNSRRARAVLYRIVDTELRKSNECRVRD
jgi:tetratricopeptide (TPR) repeat protein